MRDGIKREIRLRMIGGPMDEMVVLYVLDYEFKGKIVVPLLKDGKLTDKAAAYDMLQGLDEDGNILMSFTKIVDAPKATLFN